MTDILELLRSRHAAYDGMEPAFGKAADEIERLRSIRELIIKALMLVTGATREAIEESPYTCAAKKKAEIERLRAYALHERSLGSEGPMLELTQARQEIERLRAVIEQNAGIYQADMRRLRAQRNDWRKRALAAMPSAE